MRIAEIMCIINIIIAKEDKLHMVQFKKQISDLFFFFSSNSVLCVIQTKCIKYLVSCHL